VILLRKHFNFVGIDKQRENSEGERIMAFSKERHYFKIDSRILELHKEALTKKRTFSISFAL